MATSYLMRSRTPGFSRWSRHDVVMAPHGPTDHWAKMKVRAEGRLLSPETQENGYAKLGPAGVNINAPQKHWGSDGPDARRYLSNDPVFHKVAQSAGGKDSHLLSRSWCSSNSRSTRVPRSTYYERARQGFEYWHKERPDPTRFGRYGFGSYKTVLGLGSGPRT